MPTSTPTVGPSNALTFSPSHSPTFQPSITRSSSPTHYPTYRPSITSTSSPVREPTFCNYSSFITEIVQSTNQVIYMEVRATEECAYDTVITEDLFLNIRNDEAEVNLKDSRFDDQGFILICSDDDSLRNLIIPSYQCQPEHDFGPINSNVVSLYSNGLIDTFGYSDGPCDQVARPSI